nr:MAG TPA: hypothetical protein [Caudoviricetes sp.]
MELNEFLCGMACEYTFSDLGQPEDYGFDSWAELFKYAVQNDIDELITLDGYRADLTDEENTISSNLLIWRTNFEYVINRYNAEVTK